MFPAVRQAFCSFLLLYIQRILLEICSLWFSPRFFIVYLVITLEENVSQGEGRKSNFLALVGDELYSH